MSELATQALKNLSWLASLLFTVFNLFFQFVLSGLIRISSY